MYKLSFLILIIINSFTFSQSPHGSNFDFDCEACHTTDGWKINPTQMQFDHSQTNFELMGQHKILNCQSCHQTLKFSITKTECNDCHTDIHQNTVSLDCKQCHNSSSWLVSDIDNIHRMSRFPLLGAHKFADCQECHASVKNLIFEQIGVECIDCHINNFQATVSPNHIEAGFSKDCEECHQVSDVQWSGALIAHDFFPLTSGHKISNCFDCHTQNTFEGLNQDCKTCHQTHYDSATKPDHKAASFSTDCQECHTTHPGWKPASFSQHDNFFQLLGAHKIIENDCAKCHTTGYSNTPNQCYDCHKINYDGTTNPVHKSAGFGTDCESCHNSTDWVPATFDHDNQFFPIYSGEHNNEWNACSDCHTNSSNYQVFECTTCHEHDQNKMDDEHNDVNGYVYESTACLACHPTGSEDDGFNHSSTSFPLNGAHISTDCAQCHSDGYQGTSTDCSTCHITNFESSANPNHQKLGFDTKCEVCHTSNPGWEPAKLPNHNDFYLIQGAHLNVANDCNTCHSGNYNNTGNQCVDCHKSNYDNTNNPPHQSTGFDTSCEACHSENAWTPSTFDHDNQFFPIYSGKHNNAWNDCSDCHITASNFSIFECITCHEHNQTDTDNDHSEVQGYQYISAECLACHPAGDSDGAFNHSTTEFPLTGSHSNHDCSTCHTNGYANTSTECNTCHVDSYKNSVEPNHSDAGISINCEQCHNNVSWKPSTFTHASTGFELIGGHDIPQCSNCHQGSTSNTSPLCFDCHQNKYNSAPEHSVQSYPTTCENCHNTTDWKDTNFDHNNTNFALTGTHTTTDCAKCHTNGYTGTPSDCFACHQDKYNSAPEHSVQNYPKTCENCHNTTNWNDATFDHSNTNFALTGAHTTTDCADCHANGYSGTTTVCSDCHIIDFNNSTNPNHTNLNLSTTCETCHTTNPGWQPADFPVHNNFYLLEGAHSAISNDCNTCHSGDYNNTPNTCYGCHQSNYNATTNPPHSTSGFGTDCEDCHNQNAWVPSTFDHDGLYFPIYSGAHKEPWNSCSDCHTDQNNFSQFSCLTCHEHNQTDMDNKHKEETGYSYNSNACFDCHPNGKSDIATLKSFDFKIRSRE